MTEESNIDVKFDGTYQCIICGETHTGDDFVKHINERHNREFNLSDRICHPLDDGVTEAIFVEDVKEFIRRLRERDKLLILWARQWADYLSDEDVLDKWERKVAIWVYINDVETVDVPDLDKLAGDNLI